MTIAPGFNRGDLPLYRELGRKNGNG